LRVLRSLVGGLVVAMVVLVACPRAESSGIITHSWMARQAVPYLDDPALQAILLAHLDQLEGGAHYPDSGYAARTLGYADYGEESHWARFSNTYADQIRDSPGCGDLTARNGPCAARIAHLMGAVAHGIGDEVWDWLFEPAGVDHGERFLPQALTSQFSRNGLELQMDMIAVGDYRRRTSPAIPNWPARRRLIGVYGSINRTDIGADDLQIGYTGISVARNAEATLTQRYHDLITANMPWTSSHIVTAPGGIQFAGHAIAAVWESLWGRILGEQPDTVVGITHPAPGQVDVPTTGWDRTQFRPGSPRAVDGGGGARNRIAAVLSAALPYAALPGDPAPPALPTSAMTLTEVVSGDPVPIRSGYPRAVPYNPEAGEHTVGLQPEGNLEPCTEYRVDVTDDLLDAEGQPVVPTSWTFTTDGCPGIVRRPDAQLRIGNHGAFIGADVLSATGLGQEWTTSAAPGRTATFTVKLRNAGSDPDRLRVTGQRSVPGFRIRYFAGATDITGQVGAGTYRTAVLDPGASANVRVVVEVLRHGGANGVDEETERLVTARSVAVPTQVDGVRFDVIRDLSGRSVEAGPVADAQIEALLASPDAARWIQVCQLGES
jgi:hypothetical protein